MKTLQLIRNYNAHPALSAVDLREPEDVQITKFPSEVAVSFPAPWKVPLGVLCHADAPIGLVLVLPQGWAAACQGDPEGCPEHEHGD